MTDQDKNRTKQITSDPAAQLPPEREDEGSPTAVSLPELKRASKVLQERIDEAKRNQDLPLDSALGDPAQERAAADGHFDRREDEDE